MKDWFIFSEHSAPESEKEKLSATAPYSPACRWQPSHPDSSNQRLGVFVSVWVSRLGCLVSMTMVL